MNYGLTAEDIKQITGVFAAYPAVQKVVIFGSRAMGNYKPGSDIDLAITGDTLTFDDILQLHSQLEKLDTLYSFDMQNINTINDPAVIDHIKRVGKDFYTKK